VKVGWPRGIGKKLEYYAESFQEVGRGVKLVHGLRETCVFVSKKNGLWNWGRICTEKGALMENSPSKNDNNFNAKDGRRSRSVEGEVLKELSLGRV